MSAREIRYGDSLDEARVGDTLFIVTTGRRANEQPRIDGEATVTKVGREYVYAKLAGSAWTCRFRKHDGTESVPGYGHGDKRAFWNVDQFNGELERQELRRQVRAAWANFNLDKATSERLEALRSLLGDSA